MSGARIVAGIGLLLVLGCTGEPAIYSDDRPDLVVRATVDRSIVAPGDDITYTVELDWAPGANPAIPEFGRGIEGLRIVEQEVLGPEEIDGRETQVHTYHLVADRPGSYEIPGVEVPYTTRTDEQGTAATGVILVEAEAPVPEGEEPPPVELEEQLRDIVGKQAMADPNFALWLIVAAASFLVLTVVWALVVRGTWAAPPLPLPPPPAHEVALQELRRLRTSGMLEQGQLQPFAFELSGILRTYLEKRFLFPAREWTTTEILQGLPNPLRSARQEQGLRQVLDATDLVKYAGRPVLPMELDRLADVCTGLVEETRPEPEEEQELEEDTLG